MPVALEWGPVGARTLAERSDVVVVVDVLSFSTALTIAVERGALVWPHVGGESARQLARDIGAVLAGNRSSHEGLTLSPESLLGVDAETRLVLPSPNGSSIAFAAINSGVPVVAGCLRNAAAVSQYLDGFERVALVPAGEQWGDGSLRPAYEDLVGAGAIIDRLAGRDPGLVLTPEAEVAALAFRALRPLELCPSGAELVERGFAADVRLASEIDASDVVPAAGRGPLRPGLTALFREGCYSSNGATSRRSRPDSDSWSGCDSADSRSCSRESRSARAASTRSLPRGVSRTWTPRRSAGSGIRCTRPRSSSRSTRLVIVPEVTIVWASSWPGDRT